MRSLFVLQTSGRLRRCRAHAGQLWHKNWRRYFPYSVIHTTTAEFDWIWMRDDGYKPGTQIIPPRPLTRSTTQRVCQQATPALRLFATYLYIRHHQGTLLQICKRSQMYPTHRQATNVLIFHTRDGSDPSGQCRWWEWGDYISIVPCS